MAKSNIRTSNSKKKNIGRLPLILFPIVLIALIVLLAVLNNQNADVDQKEAVPALSVINAEEQPVLGSPEAKVSIVEFGDYKCPTCRYWGEQVFPQLKADYIDTGKVKFTFLQFPFIGTDSNTAALASEAIQAQYPEAFWDFHKELYNSQLEENVKWATPEYLTEVAIKSVPNLNVDEFKQQLADGTYQEQVDTDSNLGEKAKVMGTPAVYVNGKPVNADYQSIQKAIEEELAAVK
ncbi:DsbA family protein [Paenibacillus marinisediminis]